MAVYKVHAHLIDGNFTKTFRSLNAVAEYVQSHMDFGDDSRRSWGIQGEFGTRTFDGFTWDDLPKLIPEPIVHGPVESGDPADWTLRKWMYNDALDVSGSDWFYAWSWSIVIGSQNFHIQAKSGRFDASWDCGDGWDYIGQYRDWNGAVDAIERFCRAKDQNAFDSIWFPVRRNLPDINVLPVEDPSLIPF